jgi:predicted cupin superfamily sugar epimerase
MNAKNIIQKLGLKPHPERGFYNETYRSSQSITTETGKNRNVSTAIYYLLENEDRSLLHRIEADELWFYHQGNPIEISFIQNGQIASIVLGNDIEKGELPQAVIPANIWFASEIKNATGYSLVSCVVAPGFDFADFKLAKREDLVREYPHLLDFITKFTK